MLCLLKKKNHKRFFFFKIKTKIKVIVIQQSTTSKNEKGFVPKSPKKTFIPKKEEIIVGIDIIKVTEVKNFIVPFKLFEMIEL